MDGSAELVQSILIALGAGVGAVAIVVALYRVMVPLASRVLGKYLETRKTLDSDRDRIIANLRAEIDDYRRRLETQEKLTRDANLRADAAEAKANATAEDLHELNEFIDTLLERLGTTRERVADGEPLHPPRTRRRS